MEVKSKATNIQKYKELTDNYIGFTKEENFKKLIRKVYKIGDYYKIANIIEEVIGAEGYDEDLVNRTVYNQHMAKYILKFHLPENLAKPMIYYMYLSED